MPQPAPLPSQTQAFGEQLIYPAGIADAQCCPNASPDVSTAATVGSLLDDVRYEVGGYAKLDMIFDFDDAGDRYQFDPRALPVTGGRGEQTTFHARQSRLNLALQMPTEFGPLDFFVEGDFFGSGNAFRLRHAYGRWNQLLAGQTWSLLVDTDAFIETLDFAGADGKASIRSPQLRWTKPLNASTVWKLSVENNTVNPQSTVPGVLRNRFPVLATSLRFGGPTRHLYWFAGITESRFVLDSGPEEEATVWATGVSSRFPIGTRDHFIAKAVVGDGADSLISSRDVTDTGFALPNSGFETLTEYSYDLAFQHFWRDDLRSNLAYRWSQADNSDTQDGDAFHSVQYLAANLIWRPTSQVDVGVEYLFGQRENKNGLSHDANRLQFSFIWRLP